MSDKISIYFISDGNEWANYLTDKFTCEVYNIETVQQDFHTASSDMKTKVNVFLFTPDLAIEKNWDLLNYFDSVTSVAVLTGITHEDWQGAIETHGLESLNEWYVHELIAEEDSVRELLLLIISLYETDIVEPEEDYMNVPADLKPHSTTKVASLPDKANEKHESTAEVVPLPDKQRNASVSEENDQEIGVIDKETNETENVWVLQETLRHDQKDDKLYDELPPASSRPVNPVRYIFRQGENIYVLLEDVNTGLVQLKFRESGTLIDLACVSEKTTVYSFKHTHTERETFDVTLDGIEIGYGVIEQTEREDDYDLLRGSVVSTSSGSSSMSSRSSNASYDTPSPCSRKSIQNKQYVNFSRSHPERAEMQKMTVPKRCSSASEYVTLEDAAVSSTRSKSSKLEQIHRLLLEEIDPVNILCQSFQVDSRKHLDEKIAFMLQPTGALKGFSFETPQDATSETSDTDYPTLLHFGARFDLKIFCQCLLKNPLTRDAALKRNKNGLYPHDVARGEGYTELADHLESYARQLRSIKTQSNDSGFSQRVSQSPPSPQPHLTTNRSSPYMDMSGAQFLPSPCVTPGSNTSQDSETNRISKTRQRSILKKTSQESLTSPDDDYEVPFSSRREGSISSTGSTGSQEAHGLRVTLGPSIVIDGDKTSIPQSSAEAPLDGLPDYYEDATGKLYNRESNGIENSSATAIIRRTPVDDGPPKRKNLKSFFGVPVDSQQAHSESASAPSGSHWDHVKKHGMFKKIKHMAGMKDPSRTKSDPRLNAEAMEAIHDPAAARVGAKTLIHRKDLLESDPTSEQFRPRLQTDPGPWYSRTRPNLTLLKKHGAEKDLSSSIPDLAGSSVGGIDYLAPPPPCIHPHGVQSAPNSPFQRSKEHHYVKKAHDSLHGQSEVLLPTRVTHNSKDKEVTKRDKKKAKKEANKKKIQMTITNAQKRTSMRLIHARKAPVDAAPALPPRPQKMKSLGGF